MLTRPSIKEHIRTLATFIAFFMSVAISTQAEVGEHRETVGWKEKVLLYPDKFLIHARLVSTSDFSRLHVKKLKESMRGEERWVSFELIGPNGERKTTERLVHRNVRLRSRDGDTAKYPVALLGICLGNQYVEVDFALDEREGLSYQMLLGRNFMMGHVYIDPSSTFTTDPECQIQGALAYRDDKRQ